jgi:hypothetical protein
MQDSRNKTHGNKSRGNKSRGEGTRRAVTIVACVFGEARWAGEYNWKVSIVDLMKLLNLDSSLGARKQLAQELGYKGELNGSAEMNIWLHKQVMTKLAESGGVVPESLKHA